MAWGDDEEKERDCSSCGGRGRVTCPECNGSGTATGPDGKKHPCVREITCWSCGGSGKVR